MNIKQAIDNLPARINEAAIMSTLKETAEYMKATKYNDADVYTGAAAPRYKDGQDIVFGLRFIHPHVEGAMSHIIVDKSSGRFDVWVVTVKDGATISPQCIGMIASPQQMETVIAKSIAAFNFG